MLRTLVAALLLSASLGLAGCAPVDPNDLPRTYLEQALKAVQAHDAPTALAALNHAESLWIGANVPFSDAFFNFDPDAMREMARARQSVQMGRWGDAEYYVRTALTHPSVVTPG